MLWPTHEPRSAFEVQNRTTPMTEQEFRAIYPLVVDWIQQTLTLRASAARPVASFGFSRLRCRATSSFASARVVPG